MAELCIPGVKAGISVVIFFTFSVPQSSVVFPQRQQSRSFLSIYQKKGRSCCRFSVPGIQIRRLILPFANVCKRCSMRDRRCGRDTEVEIYFLDYLPRGCTKAGPKMTPKMTGGDARGDSPLICISGRFSFRRGMHRDLSRPTERELRNSHASYPSACILITCQSPSLKFSTELSERDISFPLNRTNFPIITEFSFINFSFSCSSENLRIDSDIPFKATEQIFNWLFATSFTFSLKNSFSLKIYIYYNVRWKTQFFLFKN